MQTEKGLKMTSVTSQWTLSETRTAKLTPTEINDIVKRGGYCKTDDNGLISIYMPASDDKSVDKKSALKGDDVKNALGLNVGQTGDVDAKTQNVQISKSVNVSELTNKFQITDTEDFKTKLKSDGFTINAEGVIEYTEPEEKSKIINAIKKYKEENATEVATFEDASDQDIQNLITQGAIELIPDTEPKQYKVLKKAEVEDLFSEKDGDPVTESVPIEADVDVTTTTKTTQTSQSSVSVDNKVDYQKDKKKRDELKAQFKTFAAEWADDPANCGAYNKLLVEGRYKKQFGKEIKNILKECPTGADVLRKFHLDSKTMPEEKKAIGKALANALKGSDEDLINAYNLVYAKDDPHARINSCTELTPEQKTDAAYALVLLQGERNGVGAAAYAERMAVRNILDSRSPKEIKQDKEWLIDDQAKKLTDAVVTEQRMSKSHMTFNKLDKHGNKLVRECPLSFCDKVENDDNYDFEETVKELNPSTGEWESHKYKFKFNEEKWDQYYLDAANTGHDNEFGESFGDDNFLTLNEARAAITRKNLLRKDGKAVSFDDVVCNGDGKVGNRELNRFRTEAKTTGAKVDRNNTVLKRFGHFAKNIGIGAAVGTATGGLGTLLGPLFGTVASSASQLIPYSGVTPDKYINVKTTDTTTTIVNNETFTKTTTHNIPVNTGGQEYSGEVNAPGGPAKVNVGTAMLTGGAVGGFSGLVTSMFTARNVHANGTQSSTIINAKEPREAIETKGGTDNFKVQITRTTYKRKKTDTKPTQIPTRPAVRYRAPEAYVDLYEVDNLNLNDWNIRKQVARKLHELWSQGKENVKYGDIPKQVPVYESFEIEIDGQKYTIKRKDNWATVNIIQGKPGRTGGIYEANTTGVVTRSSTVKITRG